MRVFRRGKSWYVDYEVNGKRFKKSFGKHKKMAELYLKDIELRSIRGELRIIDESIRIDSFLNRYIEYCKVNKSASTSRTDVCRLRIFKLFLDSKGIQKVREITPFLMEEFKGVILQSAGPVTFNHYLQLIKAMLSKAVEWEFLRHNPLSSYKLLKNNDQKQVRYFTEPEIDAILHNSSGISGEFILILLLTGMRRSELINLRWADIDFRNKLISVQANLEAVYHPKGYRPRSIPVSKELEGILLDLPQKGTFVFDSGRNAPAHTADYYTKEFQKLLSKLGILNANLHTLRHTFASYLVMNGTDIRTVQDLLGHSTVKVTEQYSHLSPVHRLKALETLNFRGNKGTKEEQFENGKNNPT